MHNLPNETFFHIEHFRNQHEFVLGCILRQYKHFHSFVPDLLPHQSPVLIVLFLGCRFLHVKGHHFLANSHIVFYVLLEFGDQHGEVVSSVITTGTLGFIAVIKVFKDAYLLFEVAS
jgi:hypothetical protein